MNRLGSLRGRGWQGAWRARIAGTIIVGVCMTSFGMAQPLTTVRVSVSSSGEQGNLKSSVPSISADGRYVAFISHATNLVSGDTNGEEDVFVNDRMAGTTERVSVSSTGEQGNLSSGAPSISADGRYIAFMGLANNLVSGDSNGGWDVFVRDRLAGSTERVSVSSSGDQGTSSSYYPSISADGRYVAFQSYASNLISGDTNGDADIFVRDRQAGTTERVSIASNGKQGNQHSYSPSISGDGRYVAFDSAANTLVMGDSGGWQDVFVRDRQAGTTERVSLSSSGVQGNWDSFYPSISADGRYVAFGSYASNLISGDTNGFTDVFVRDRPAGTTERVSVSSSEAQGNGNSDIEYGPSISADGRYVAFTSYATNLVAGDTNGTDDVFVRDRQAGTTERVSVSSSWAQGNLDSFGSSISADGRYVACMSYASNLVAGDTNGEIDVFVRSRLLIAVPMAK
jgi:Tol biopolymer transport system component